MRRVLAVVGAATAFTIGAAAPAVACGGLIGPNGAVNLLRTTTFAGYANGVEHYVTSFSFAGGGGAFGSLTPLPGVPTKVERGGDWTLQRLVRETVRTDFAGSAAPLARASSLDEKAQVILQTKVDALDITVLKGGGKAVGEWATEHGFRLPPDAPEVLDFYAERSPIFLAAAFDADEAARRGQQVGDGTPVHITIPTDNPWVPLRILALGKQAQDPIDADVYLLTEERPTLLSTTPIGSPGTGDTLTVVHDEAATPSLLEDLRTDKTGGWVPEEGWLTKVQVSGPAGTLTGDLAIDATGERAPSMTAAGFNVALGAPGTVGASREDSMLPAVAVGLMAAFAVGAMALASRRL